MAKLFMENNKHEVISWEGANDLLFSYLGCSVYELNKLDKLITDVFPVLHKVDNWEEKSDMDILTEIKLEHYMTGLAYIITDMSYIRNVGLFKVNLLSINLFVQDYFSVYTECLFNGDVIFISPASNKMLIFHHDGFFILLNLPLNKTTRHNDINL